MEKRSLKNSIGIRLLIIGFLSLVLLIPAVMIQLLISERQDRRDAAYDEVAGKWGSTQTISGPVLTVPYTVEVTYESGKTEEIIKYAHLLPDSLKITGALNPELRYRGIYEIVLYNADLNLRGRFTPQEIGVLNIPAGDLIWEEAFISVGISDMKGIKRLIEFKWNNSSYPLNPGIETVDVFKSGISEKIPSGAKGGVFDFEIDINLNGSRDLFFTPLGIVTDVALKSDWKNPSFTGNFLPEWREVGAAGFSAKWQILHLNRNFPQKWTGNQYNVDLSKFGVKLLVPVDEYQKTMRTAKYAIMFISLTFLTFFMIELLNRNAIHPIQYLLTGFALLVFYTLLLSLSEHMVFNYAYILSGSAIIILISAYSKSVLKSTRQTMIVGGILVLLYGYLFIVLQLQDYALLMGSLGLFAILAFIMYLTRKTDWFSVLRASPGTEEGK